ncbi:MAG: hypothetical protein ABRQ38_22935 [Candidatus Eremiobacterota bacterium]
MSYFARVEKVEEYNMLQEGEVTLKIEGLLLRCETSDLFIEETHCIVDLYLRHGEITKTEYRDFFFDLLEPDDCVIIIGGKIKQKFNEYHFLLESLLDIEIMVDEIMEFFVGDSVIVKGVLRARLAG